MKEDAVDEMDRLIDLSNSGTRKNYVENALAIMEWALTMSQSGLTVAAIDENKGTFRELVMPPISRMKKLREGRTSVGEQKNTALDIQHLQHA
jgi:hypothetical protein